MEHKPLAIIMFNEILGYFESEAVNKERDQVLHRLHIRKGVAKFLESLLSRCQVVLFIDVNSVNSA